MASAQSINAAANLSNPALAYLTANNHILQVQLCFIKTRQPAWCTTEHPFWVVTQPFTLCGIIMWISAVRPSDNNEWWWRTWMPISRTRADAQSKSAGVA